MRTFATFAINVVIWMSLAAGLAVALLLVGARHLAVAIVLIAFGTTAAGSRLRLARYVWFATGIVVALIVVISGLQASGDPRSPLWEKLLFKEPAVFVLVVLFFLALQWAVDALSTQIDRFVATLVRLLLCWCGSPAGRKRKEKVTATKFGADG
jgi:hypothetical protein